MKVPLGERSRWRWVVLLTAIVGILGVSVAMGTLGLGFVEGPEDRTIDSVAASHGHPDELLAAETDDVDRLLDQLLGGQIEQAARHLSEEDADRAEEALGERYEELLERYRGETDDAARIEAYAALRDDQAALGKLVSAYNTSRAEYTMLLERDLAWPGYTSEMVHERGRTVVQNGIAVEAQINETLAFIEDAPIEVGEETVRDYTSLREQVRTERAMLVSRHFVETELEVAVDDERTSFVRPLRINGTLRTEAGEPITNEAIVLEVYEKSFNVTTDTAGRFSISYRPVHLPVDATNVTVAYRAEPASSYLDSEATVDVAVEQITPTLEVDEISQSLRVDQSVSVSGSMTVEGIAINDTVVTVNVDGVRLANALVVDGRFVTNVTVPPRVGAGDGELTVRYLPENKSIGPANASTPVSVASTPASLTLEATHEVGRTVVVSGMLETEAGMALADQRLALVVDGQIVGHTRTGADGAYTVAVEVPEEVVGGSTEVGVVYDEAGTSIESAEESTLVEIPDADNGVGWWWLVLAGLVVILGVSGVVFRRYRGGDDGTGPVEGESLRVAFGDDAADVTSLRSSLLEHARRCFDAGEYRSAVYLGYTAVRANVRPIETRGLTHWEFLDRYRRSGGGEATIEHLERMTETFDRAAFGADGVTREEARALLNAIESMFNSGSIGVGHPSDD